MENFWTERFEPWSNNADDARSPWETDYGRIVHSSSFRRLQGKTQILNLGDSDFYRTRLTHSIEVAQIARGLVQQLKINYPEDEALKSELPDPILAQSIGSTHDLGHPPFGHGGEYALNYCMRDDGGFEGNGQTLRLLSKLERFSSDAGSNLTRRALLGVLKYPISYSKARGSDSKPSLSQNPTTLKILNTKSCRPPKCYLNTEQRIVDWIFEPIPDSDRGNFFTSEGDDKKGRKAIHKSFDCSIMDLADDIAYGVHDLEDVIAMGLFSKDDFLDLVPEEDCGSFLEQYAYKAPEEVGNNHYEWLLNSLFGDASSRKRCISRFVGHFITNVSIERLGVFETNQLDLRAKLPDKHDRFLKALKDAVMKKVIKTPEVQHLEFKGQQLVVSVFETYMSDPERFLPSYAMGDFEKCDNQSRFISDHVAGMTDNYLLKTYERLFSPRMGSTFDKL